MNEQRRIRVHVKEVGLVGTIPAFGEPSADLQELNLGGIRAKHSESII